MGRPAKWPQELVDEIRYQRVVEERSIKWLARKYEVPIDTIRDWLYRGARKNDSATPPGTAIKA